MSNFDQNEYNKLYNSTKRKRFSWNISNDEYDSLYEYCTNINVQISTYLKNLVNADAIARGYDPIFANDRRRKQGKESNGKNDIT